MILVDTSVWIDFFADKLTFEVSKLTQAIESHENLYICGVIITEIMQGIRHQRERDKISEILESLIYLEIPKEVFLLSAEIYRNLKSHGITIRKTIDCIIASVAISNDLILLHNDKDFRPIEKYCGLNACHHLH